MLTTYLRRDLFDECISDYNNDRVSLEETAMEQNEATRLVRPEDNNQWNRNQWHKYADQVEGELVGCRATLREANDRNSRLVKTIAYLDRIINSLNAEAEKLSSMATSLRHAKELIDALVSRSDVRGKYDRVRKLLDDWNSRYDSWAANYFGASIDSLRYRIAATDIEAGDLLTFSLSQPIFCQVAGRFKRQSAAELEADAFLLGRKLNDHISDLDIHSLSSDAWDIVREQAIYSGNHQHVYWQVEHIEGGPPTFMQCKCGIVMTSCSLFPWMWENKQGDWSWAYYNNNEDIAARAKANNAVAAWGCFVAARAVRATEPLKG